MFQRQTHIDRVQQTHFDLCVIGGGASGAGCALDAALRGLKVVLVEKHDFAAETSSKSTKMIHGGVRYLEQAVKKLDLAQLKQVRHGLKERQTVLKNAPHLARPLGLITPVFNWWEGLYYFIGLTLYEWFAAKSSSLPKSRWLSKKKALQYLPGLNPGIHSAVLYYDGQLDDARYCLALVQSAIAAGATVVNHLEITGFEAGATGVITSARTLDHLDQKTITLHARQFLNCAGPQADHIRKMANPALETRIAPSKGVHLVLPGDFLGLEYAMLIPKTKDGRMAFVIPFEKHLLIGTTDEPYRHGDAEPVLEQPEVEFLLNTLQPFLQKKIDPSAVKAGFGGIRPLVRPGKGAAGKSTKSMLRDHEVETDDVSGLVSLLGGKWTTYRLMAADAVDQICRNIHHAQSSCTDRQLLWGANGWSEDFWKKIQTDYDLPEDVSQHLAGKYGTNAPAVAELIQTNPQLGEKLVAGFPFIGAEVVYAVRFEMACTIRDFLARRIRLEITHWNACFAAVPVVAEWMGTELNWSTSDKTRNILEYQHLLKHFQQTAAVL